MLGNRCTNSALLCVLFLWTFFAGGYANATSAYAPKTTISMSTGTVIADGVTTSTITVQAKKFLFGNITSGGDTIVLWTSYSSSIFASPGGNATISSITDNNNGSYTATITSTVAETVYVHGSLNGTQATGFSSVGWITFVAGPAAISNSIVTVSAASISADSASASTVTVQTIDAQGNYLTTGGDPVAVSVDGSASVSNFTDHGNGTYTATITNSVIESTNVGVTLGGTAIAATETVDFIAGTPPTIANNNGATFSEGSTQAITNSMLAATDADSTISALAFTVTSTTANGYITLNNSPATNFTQDDINNGRVKFVHDHSNTTSAGFDFYVEDGLYQSNTESFAITISPVDDDIPTLLTNNGTSGLEGGNITIDSSHLLATDSEANDNDITYEISNIVNGTVECTCWFWSVTNFTQGQLNANQVYFVHDDSNTLTGGFDFAVRDPNNNYVASSQSFSIAITAVDDDIPTVVNNAGPTINEGSTDITITSAMLSATDSDSSDSTLIYTITSENNGSISVNGGSATSFTPGDLANNVVEYSHDDSNTTTGGFNFTVKDPANNEGTGQAFVFAITPIDDDTATIDINTGSIVTEGESLTITNTMLTTNDTDTAANNLTYTVTNEVNGSITLNSVTASSFTQDDINNNFVMYVHDGSNTITGSFDFTVKDPANNQPAAETFTLTVTATDDNTATIVNNTGTDVDEGSSVVISNIFLSASDVDTADSSLIFTVSNESNGSITVKNVAASSFTQNDIDNDHVEFVQDGSNTTAGGFDFTVKDPADNELTGQSFAITINFVNDNPIAIADSAALNEGDSVTIDLRSNDNDEETATGSLIVTNLSLANNGTLTNNNDGSVTYTHDGSETTSDSFTYTINDGGLDSAPATVTITIGAINDTPSIENNVLPSIAEGTVLALTNTLLKAVDVDTDDTTLIYAISNVVNGIVTVSGVTVSSFSQGDIDAGTVQFEHNDSNTIIAEFDFTVSDGIDTLTGQNFSITIIPLDDDTATSTNSSIAVAQGSTVTLSASNLSSTDTDTDDTTLIYTVSNVINGTLSIDGNYWANGTNNTFTQLDINSGNVIYTHDGSSTASDSFNFSVEDASGNSLSGQSFSISVSPVSEISFLKTNYFVAEDATEVTIKLVRLGIITGTASVEVALAGGSAEEGSHFTFPQPVTVSWGNGDNGMQEITIPLIDDHITGNENTIEFTLQSEIAAVLGNKSTATVSIMETIDSVGFGRPRFRAAEENGFVEVEIVRNGTGAGAVEVSFIAAPGDDGVRVAAQPGEDYTVNQSLITWADGETGIKTISIDITADNGDANGEYFTLTLDEDTLIGNAILNTASKKTDVVIFDKEALGNLVDANSKVKQLADALDNICDNIDSDNTTAVNECNKLHNLNESGVEEVLAKILPTTVQAQVKSAVELAGNQLKNMRKRLTELRSGQNRISITGLNMSLFSENVPLTAAMQSMVNDSIGGSAGADGDLLANRWGAFINGTLAIGTQDDIGDALGYEVESKGITAGIDYRITPKMILGMALGFGSSNSVFNQNSGEQDATNATLTVFGNHFINNSIYADWVVSYSLNQFEIEHQFIDNDGATHIMLSSPVGNQYSISIGGGYDLVLGALQITGFTRADYINSTIDAYVETGDELFSLSISEQNDASMDLALGVKSAYVFALKSGVITPSIEVEWVQNYQGEERTIDASLALDPSAGSFSIVEEAVDSSHLNAAFSLAGTFSSGKSFYFRYDTLLNETDRTSESFTIGGRFEF